MGMRVSNPLKMGLALCVDRRTLGALFRFVRKRQAMSVSTPSSPRVTSGNLHSELTTFVGRRSALADGRRLMSASVRCLTLIGPGGVGKTRLALRVAANIRQNYEAVWFVEYGKLRDDARVGQLLAETLGLRTVQEPATSALVEHLANRHVLLVLDNCEHLPSIAAVTHHLLQWCPGLQVITTSRSPVGVPGEHLLQVPPLTTPGPDAVATPQEATRHEAVALFVDRAKAAAGFSLTPDNTALVMSLCRRLAGLPLAVELAAAKLRAMSLNEIVNRLGDQLFILTTGGSPVAPDRHRTLRSTLDWSYALCSDKEQSMWERLSVFAGGGFDLNGAEYVCVDDSAGGIKQQDVIGLITALVDKSIVRRVGARYTQLAPIYEYGASLLAESEDARRIHERHTEWVRRMSIDAADQWFSLTHAKWVGRLTAERDNIRVAISHALSEPTHAHVALEIVGNLWAYWSAVFGSFSEARDYLSQGLALDTDQTPTRATALWVSAWFALRQGDFTGTATESLAECRTLAEHLADSLALAYSIHLEGVVAYFDGDTDDAIERLKDAHSRYQVRGDALGVSMALCHLTMACATAGDQEAATAYGRQALTMADDNPALLSRSCALWALSYGQWVHGQTHTDHFLTQALRIMQTAGDKWGLAEILEVQAWRATAEEDDEHAARLFGAAQNVWESIDTTIPGVHPLAIPHDQCVTELRNRLGLDGYEHAFHDGHINGVIIEAETLTPPKRATESGNQQRFTPRENEVAQLIAAGKTNREIAQSLRISQRTVDRHIENMFSKLGVTKRTKIAAWVSENKRSQN